MKLCSQETRLTSWLLGDLSPAESDAMRLHLEACPACRAAAAELTPLLDTLRDALHADATETLSLEPDRLATVLATPARRRRRTRFWLAPVIGLAATGLIVLSAALLFPAFEQSTVYCVEYLETESVDSEHTELAQYARGDTDRLLLPSQTAREAAGPPAQNTGDSFGRDGGLAVHRDSTTIRGRPSSAAAPAKVQRQVGVLREEPQAEATSRITSDRIFSDELGFSIESKVACPPLSQPITAQPAPMDCVMQVKSPVIMRGIYGSRDAGIRGAMGKTAAFDADDIAVELFDDNGRIAADTPALPGGAPTGATTGKTVSGGINRIQARGGEEDAKKQSHRLMDKLSAIIIPDINFRQASLEDVVAFFQSASREYGDPASAVEERCVVIRVTPELSKRYAQATTESGLIQTPISFRARFVNLADVLKTVADVTDAKIVERDGVLVLEVQDAPAEPVVRAPPPPPLAFNPFVDTITQPFSTFAIDVDTASYTLARQSLLNGNLPEPGTIRTEEVVNAFDYGDRASDHATFRIFVEGASTPFRHGTTLVRLGIKGRRLGREEERPAILTFVVDASGSMGQPDRIGFARQALAELLERLSPKDRVQLISFNDTARVLVDSWEPVGGGPAVLAAFDRLQCTGSTHLEAGLLLAYSRAAATFVPGAENRVILISDGVANLGSGSAADILTQIDSARRQGITLSVFGVGRGAYNDDMLEQLANRGDGAYRFLDSADEVHRAFVEDLAATLYNIASDVKIQVEWFPGAIARYRQLGYENRALTAEQFRDDSVDAGEVGSGQSVTALYEVERAPTAPRAAANEPIGMIRVRYRPATGGPVDEISRPILPADLSPAFTAARPAFRVAACAAAFAEKLRHSPHAASYTYADIVTPLRSATLEFPLDTRIAELLRLVETASQLSR